VGGRGSGSRGRTTTAPAACTARSGWLVAGDWIVEGGGVRRGPGSAARGGELRSGAEGFWIARYLFAQGIEVQVMHPASIPVLRRGRRAKTDRIDLDMLLRTPLAWLRGEPRVCLMARIASEPEEEQRRPGRERERPVSERLQLESRIESLLCLHGVIGFKPRLKKAIEWRRCGALPARCCRPRRWRS
jgi:transposase